jgi:hypothetical protein
MVIGIMFGAIILEMLHLRTFPPGTIPFGIAYLHSFLILAIFNVFDAVVLDLFVIMVLKPKFVILPGTEGMQDAIFNDYRKQVTDFLKGMVFSIVVSVPFALIAVP